MIVAREASQRLRRCLQSVSEQSHRPRETFVCTVDALRVGGDIAAYDAKVIPLDACSHVSALNRGITQTTGEDILCLNDDVTLNRHYLAETLKAFRIHPRIGMVTGKILRPDGRTLDGTGQFPGRTRKAIDRGYRQRDFGQFNNPGYVFGPGGAAPLYRRAMLEKIALRSGEYFDEAFGMYYEDLDLAWRAQRAGWKGYYTPEAIAYHERGSTSHIRHGNLRHYFYLPQLPDPLLELAVVNRYRTMLRNDLPIAVLRNLPAIAAFELCQWGYLALRSPRLAGRCARRLWQLLHTARWKPRGSSLIVRC